jgi:hypothetical protein
LRSARGARVSLAADAPAVDVSVVVLAAALGAVDAMPGAGAAGACAVLTVAADSVLTVGAGAVAMGAGAGAVATVAGGATVVLVVVTAVPRCAQAVVTRARAKMPRTETVRFMGCPS